MAQQYDLDQFQPILSHDKYNIEKKLFNVINNIINEHYY